MSIGKPISTHLPTWNVKNHALELQLLHEYLYVTVPVSICVSTKQGLDYKQESNKTRP